MLKAKKNSKGKWMPYSGLSPIGGKSYDTESACWKFLNAWSKFRHEANLPL